MKPHKPVVFFGGTFDPVHLGHVALARAALTELQLERLTVLPVGNPYQRGRTPFASAEQRVAMLRLAFEHDSGISIDERELHREGATYTVDTLTEIRAELGADIPFVWLIGSDAFAKLHTWHRWRDLFTLTNFAVIMRAGVELTASTDVEFETEILPRELKANLSMPVSGAWMRLKTSPPPISSTAVRLALAHHKSIRAMVPERVCDYIKQNNLYQSRDSASIQP